MALLLDQLLLPQRLAQGLTRDLRRIADAAQSVATLAGEMRPRAGSLAETFEHAVAALDDVNGHLARLQAALEPMSEDLDRIRTAFAATSDELESLRKEVRPELAGVREATERVDSGLRSQVESVEKLDRSLTNVGDLLGNRLSALQELLAPVVRDAGEVREVVEPLQGATKRVGRIAERLPGPGKKS